MGPSLSSSSFLCSPLTESFCSTETHTGSPSPPVPEQQNIHRKSPVSHQSPHAPVTSIDTRDCTKLMGIEQLVPSSSAGSLGTGNCVTLPVSLQTMGSGILRGHDHRDRLSYCHKGSKCHCNFIIEENPMPKC